MTTIAALRAKAKTCTRCALFERATQTVFGEGPTGGLMLIGEQPGDVEDRRGRPFVGPAGSLLRELIAEVGIAAEDAYVTNAVKHFKWRPAGKRRIHDKPNASEIRACSRLELELAVVAPEFVVCLGGTAAQAVFGHAVKTGDARGQLHAVSAGLRALVTLHPSAVLRAGNARVERRGELLDDLALAARLLERSVAQTAKTTKS